MLNKTHTHTHKQEHPHLLQSTVQTNYDFMKTVPFAIHILKKKKSF
jgi:uncharacterized protein Usg